MNEKITVKQTIAVATGVISYEITRLVNITSFDIGMTITKDQLQQLIKERFMIIIE